MRSLLLTPADTPLAACRGWRPEDWLRFLWQAGAGAPAEVLGRLLDVGAEAMRALVAHGFVGRLIEAASDGLADASEETLRGRLAGLVRTTVLKCTQSDRMPACVAMWAYVTRDMGHKAALAGLVDQLVRSLQRKRRAAPAKPRGAVPRHPANPTELSIEQTDHAYLQRGAQRGSLYLRRLIARAYFDSCWSAAAFAAHQADEEIIERPERKRRARPEADLLVEPVTPPPQVIPPKQALPPPAAAQPSPKRYPCPSPAEIARRTGVPEAMAECFYRDITDGLLPLHALDEIGAHLRQKLTRRAQAPP